MVVFAHNQISVHSNVHAHVDILDLDVKQEFISVQQIRHIALMGLLVTKMLHAV